MLSWPGLLADHRQDPQDGVLSLDVGRRVQRFAGGGGIEEAGERGEEGSAELVGRHQEGRSPAQDPREDVLEWGQRHRLALHSAGQERDQSGRHDRLGEFWFEKRYGFLWGL